MATTAKIAKEEKKLAEIAARASGGKTVKFADPAAQPLQELRTAARLSPQVFVVPDLLPQVCAGGRNSGRDEGQLVSARSPFEVTKFDQGNERC